MQEANPNSRLETFCDGVFAIALTLLIIDIRIPESTVITTNQDLWRALQHMAPSLFAFALSFTVIFISWVNHHACFAQVNRSSVSFVWANGFLLLTIVLIPFPTALLGAYLFTDHAAPAVVIYNAVAAVQAVGWILVCGAALGDGLTRSSTSAAMMRDSRRNAFVGWALYSLLALLGFWFPRVSAMVTAMSWAFWLIFGIRRFGVRSE